MRTPFADRGLAARFVLLTGLAWALTEIVFGSRLTAGCPSGMTGSILTGTSLLFVSAALSAGGSAAALAVLALAAGGKVLGAALLGRPLLGGAVINPCYAYGMETVTGVAALTALAGARAAGIGRISTAGALGGLAASVLFITAGRVTGVPACVHAGSGLPLSIHYAPIAVAIGAAAAPLGRAAALHAAAAARPIPARIPRLAFDLASGAAFAGLLAAYAFLG